MSFCFLNCLKSFRMPCVTRLREYIVDSLSASFKVAGYQIICPEI